MIRRGNTIVVRWSVLTNGEAMSLEGRDLRIFISSTAMRHEVTDYAIEGHEITFKWEGTEQRHAGRYDLTLYENYGKANQSVVDACNAFTLVERSCQASQDSSDNIAVEYVELTGNVQTLIGTFPRVMSITFSPCGSDEKYAVGQVSGELFEQFFDELPEPKPEEPSYPIYPYYAYGDMGDGENFSGIGEWDEAEEASDGEVGA